MFNKKSIKKKGYYEYKSRDTHKVFYSSGRRRKCRVIDLLREDPRWKGVFYYKIPDDSVYTEDNPTIYEDEK